jgi:hypothetical protein
LIWFSSSVAVRLKSKLVQYDRHLYEQNEWKKLFLSRVAAIKILSDPGLSTHKNLFQNVATELFLNIFAIFV